jgi:hypothetical protein
MSLVMMWGMANLLLLLLLLMLLLLLSVWEVVEVPVL